MPPLAVLVVIGLEWRFIRIKKDPEKGIFSLFFFFFFFFEFLILCFAVESYSRILGPHLNGHTRQTSPCWILYWSTWLCLTYCSQSWTNYGFLVYFSKKGFGMVQKWSVNSVDVRMLQKSCLRITYICKMIVLFSILKQLPTVVIVKLWQLIWCVYIYDCKIITTLNYDYFLIYKFVRMWNTCQFLCNFHKIQTSLVAWLKFSLIQNFYNGF